MGQIHYNVTLTVDPSVETEWRQWMIAVHIPDVCSRPGFLGATMYKMTPISAQEGVRPQYVNAYTVESQAALDAYLKSPEAAQFREDHQKKFGQYATATRAVWTPIATLP